MKSLIHDFPVPAHLPQHITLTGPAQHPADKRSRHNCLVQARNPLYLQVGSFRVVRDLLFLLAPPRSQTRNPSRNVRAEFFILAPVTFPQDRFFVDENEETESQANCSTVFKKANAAKKQPLTEN